MLEMNFNTFEALVDVKAVQIQTTDRSWNSKETPDD